MNKTIPTIIASCVAAAVAGYLLAYQPIVRVTVKAEISPIPGRSPDNNRPGKPEAAQKASVLTIRTPNQLAIVKEDLRRRLSSCASPAYDCVLQQEVGAILATMSTQELEQFARELVPKKANGSDVTVWQSLNGKRTLVCEIFRQWGLKDPAGACLGLVDVHSYADDKVFEDWLRRDPLAARAWVTAGNFPSGAENYGKQLQQDFMEHQALDDLAAARDSLAMFDLDTQKKTLLEWSQRLAHDPTKRDELLALVASRGDPVFTQQCYERLVREMAVKSPQDASAFLESSSLPDDQKHALSEQMLGEWARQDPHQAFAAWANLKDDSAPAPLLRAMDMWSLNSPGKEEALAWVKTLDPGPAKEQFKAHLVESLSGGERYEQAADLSGTLADPIDRIRQMKIVKRQWDEKYPEWAEKWFRKLPQADREAIEGKLD